GERRRPGGGRRARARAVRARPAGRGAGGSGGLPPPLTPVEVRRREIAQAQPSAWVPTAADLDPNSDVGWDAATKHELIAIRPEDVPAPPPIDPAAQLAPPPTYQVAATSFVPGVTVPLGWSPPPKEGESAAAAP